LSAYYDQIAIRGLALAQLDVNRGMLDHDQRVRIKGAIDAVIDNLCDVPPAGSSASAGGVPAPILSSGIGAELAGHTSVVRGGARLARRGIGGNAGTTAAETWDRSPRSAIGLGLATQFRLFLHSGAYWLLRSMRRVMPKRSTWRVMQFDTLRLRLIKIAARVVELKTQLKIHLPSSAPDQAIFATLLTRLPRLVT
jgi:hypothetical protein